MPTLRSLAGFASRLTGGTRPAAPPTRRDRRQRAVIAVAVGVVAAVSLHVALASAAEWSFYLRDPVYADKERKLARLERALPSDSPVVVFIGTSRTGNGFAAGRAQEVLTETLGRPAGAFNFGTPASGPVMHLLHLRRLLADGHRPTLLLLEIHAPTFARLPDGPLEARFANGATFEWDELDFVANYGFDANRLREKRREVAAAPWYALRFQIVGRLSPTALPFHLRYDWGRAPDPNGWNAMLFDDLDDNERAIGVARADREYREHLAGLKFGDAPVRAVRDFLALAREHGIPVMLVRMPEGTTFRAFYTRRVATMIERFTHELATEFGCRVADCRDWMPDEAFADGHHLLRAPAGVFTDRFTRDVLAPALRAATGGGSP